MADAYLDKRKCGGRERLLHAAHALAQQRTFDEVTVDEIAKEAQLSRPSFYYHFAGGKEELRTAMVQRGLLPDTATPDMREEMLKAALSVFARAGFSSATMEDIATEAGVSRGALNWQFRSKEDLLRAIIEQGDYTRIRQALAELDQQLASGEKIDDEAILRQLAGAFYDGFTQRSDLARLPFLLLYTHPQAAHMLSEKVLNGRKRIHDYIKRRQEEGVFCANIEPSLLVHLMATAFIMRAVSRDLYDRLPLARLSREETIEQIVSLLLYGMMRREGRE